MTRNVEMFDRVADAIEAAPEQYSQQVYGLEGPCGTMYCVAGWAAHLAGWEPTLRRKVVNGIWVDSSDEHSYITVQKDGTKQFVSVVARKLLGLTKKEDYALFEGSWVPPSGMTVPEALRAIGRGELEPMQDYPVKELVTCET